MAASGPETLTMALSNSQAGLDAASIYVKRLCVCPGTHCLRWRGDDDGLNHYTSQQQ